MPIYNTLLNDDKVYQWVKDDCLKCCIASLLHLPYEAVPNFFAGLPQGVPVPATVNEFMQRWFNDRGHYLIEVPMSADSVEEMMQMLAMLHPGLNMMLSGKSPRGKDHAVIVRDGQLIHDPSRDGGGIIGPCYTGLYYAGYIGVYT